MILQSSTVTAKGFLFERLTHVPDLKLWNDEVAMVYFSTLLVEEQEYKSIKNIYTIMPQCSAETHAVKRP